MSIASISSLDSSAASTLFSLGSNSNLTTNSGMNLSISGLESGLDWQSLVSEIEQADRAPETVLQNQQTTIQGQNTALGAIITALKAVQKDVTALQQDSLYDACSASVGDSTVLSATADDSTADCVHRAVDRAMRSAPIPY